MDYVRGCQWTAKVYSGAVDFLAFIKSPAAPGSPAGWIPSRRNIEFVVLLRSMYYVHSNFQAWMGLLLFDFWS